MSYKQQTIKLRADSNTPKGKMLECLQSNPVGVEAAMWQLIYAWYGAYALDPDDPQLLQIVTQCVGLLEGQARAIREYTELTTQRGFKPLTLPKQEAGHNKFNPIHEDLEEENIGGEFDQLSEQLGL